MTQNNQWVKKRFEEGPTSTEVVLWSSGTWRGYELLGGDLQTCGWEGEDGSQQKGPTTVKVGQQEAADLSPSVFVCVSPVDLSFLFLHNFSLTLTHTHIHTNTHTAYVGQVLVQLWEEDFFLPYPDTKIQCCSLLRYNTESPPCGRIKHCSLRTLIL